MLSSFRMPLLIALLATATTVAAQDATTAPTAAAPAVAVQAAPAADAAATPATAAPAEAIVEAVPASVAAPAVVQGHIAPPPAGKGQVVFFRPSKFAGAAFGFKVREGSNELGKLRSGNYFVAEVEPGAHQYIVHSEAKDILNMEVEAGETYYVEGTMTMGFMAGHPNLSPSDQATFDGMFAKLKLVQ
jgi:hypothetical protein